MRISDWNSDVCSSDLVGYELMAKDFAAVVKMVKTLGADTIVLPWLAEEQRTEAGFGAVIAGLNGFAAQARDAGLGRSEERRVGREGVSTCRSRGSPVH